MSSTIGRSPVSAAPTAAPTIPSSLIGVDRVKLGGSCQLRVDYPAPRLDDRIELRLPAFDLLLRLVLARIAVVVAFVAVGLGDEERRAVAAARTGDELAGGRVYLAHVE